jgi:hypothetical protein
VHLQADEIELTQLARAPGELISRDRTWNDVHGTAASLRQWSGTRLSQSFRRAPEHAGASRNVTASGIWIWLAGTSRSEQPRMLIEEQPIASSPAIGLSSRVRA